MLKALSEPAVQAVLLVAVLVIVLLIAYYALRKFRDHIRSDDTDTGELLTNFEEIHHQGTLSDEEYRTIKTALHDKLRHELKDKGETT